MLNEANVKRYCKNIKNIESIENYEKAKADDFNGWCLHHRLETHNPDGERRLVDIKMDELIALDMYYNVPADQLIFMTASEHSSLHNKRNQYHLGKRLSDETKSKLSEVLSGKNNPMYGKKHSEESKRKMSETKKNIEIKKEDVRSIKEKK